MMAQENFAYTLKASTSNTNTSLPAQFLKAPIGQNNTKIVQLLNQWYKFIVLTNGHTEPFTSLKGRGPEFT